MYPPTDPLFVETDILYKSALKNGTIAAWTPFAPVPTTALVSKSTSVGNVLLFYNSVTLSSLVMSMNDDHAYIGIFIVLPLCDGWGEPPFPRLICLIPEPAPTAYMFVYLFWSTISIPAKWPLNVNCTVFSSLLA